MDLQDGKRMFGEFKSKLPFGNKNQGEQYDDYADDYDNYEEYDEYDEYADDYNDGYDSGYDRYASTTSTRSSGMTPRERLYDASRPRLVSFDDVRANTQMGSYDSLPASGGRGSSFGRTVVDSSMPVHLTPEGAAAVSAQATISPTRSRSEGLDSLFEPTAEPVADEAPRVSRFGATGLTDMGSLPQVKPASAVQRTLNVIKPTSYADAEGVARALKNGDAVILLLADVPEDLTKRILDFSFGAAAVLDAGVESVGRKTFAITTGAAMTELELSSLRAQGVIA